MPPGSSLIEIDLLDRDGGTLLRMTHSGLPDAEECASHEKGWTYYLGRLEVAAAGGDPGPDLPREIVTGKRASCAAGGLASSTPPSSPCCPARPATARTPGTAY